MSKDIAQRELDQAGFRISNLGAPTAADDATKTDNTTVPHANAGTGSPGVSLLAAPADHVHPSHLVTNHLDRAGQQHCVGMKEQKHVTGGVLGAEIAVSTADERVCSPVRGARRRGTVRCLGWTGKKCQQVQNGQKVPSDHFSAPCSRRRGSLADRPG